jgi:hypothetical protein
VTVRGDRTPRRASAQRSGHARGSWPEETGLRGWKQTGVTSAAAFNQLAPVACCLHLRWMCREDTARVSRIDCNGGKHVPPGSTGGVVDSVARWAGPLLVTAAAAFAAVQGVAWPVAIAAQDEASYLAGAYILRQGTVFADVAQVPLLWGVSHAGHTAPLYPPGQSALLAPFTLGGWRLAFAANLLAHLTGFFLFSVLLRRLEIRRVWALLYLFFPPLVLYSRTLMSDVSSAALTVAVLLAWLGGPRGRALAGALLGASLFLRYANLLTFILLALAAGLGDLAALRHGTRGWRTLRLPPLVAGFVPLCALFLAHNLAVYGHLTTPGYVSAGLFALRHLPGHLPVYAAVLMLIYPLMLLAPLAYRGRLRVEVLVIGYGVLLAQSAYYFLNTYGGLAERAVVGSRLLFPAVPLFLVAYAQAFDRVVDWAPGRIQTRVPVVAGGLLLLGTLATLLVSNLHQQRLQHAAQVRAAIERTAPRPALHLINGETAKFLSPAWGNRQYQVVSGQDLSAARPQPQAGQPVAVIYTAHGADTPDLATTRAVAARYNARLMLDWWSEWHVMVWRTSPDDRDQARADRHSRPGRRIASSGPSTSPGIPRPHQPSGMSVS